MKKITEKNNFKESTTFKMAQTWPKWKNSFKNVDDQKICATRIQRNEDHGASI